VRQPIVSGAHVENIGPRGARRRMLGGVAWLIIAIVAAVVLVWLDVSRSWRLFLFLPFSLAATGFLQARERT
jgi:hypothetical protein